MMTNDKCVLVVDDEEDIRDGVSRWLRAAGFETITAADGEQGLAKAMEIAPHAILLDMLMPRKDGLQTLSELRQHRETSDIPVVMLSASLRDEERTLDAGARYFVHKPFDGKTLVSTIRAAINPQPVSYC